ncbi:hypothetical protein M3Y99_01208700 [Aphelenchoides fujianensis]|nr:hypothetical protein M3Y99_01208700 [Aphelenchoides fujianensis]
MKVSTLVAVLLLVASVRCAPVLFSKSLLMRLLPQTIASAVDGLSAEQLATYNEVRAKYEKPANGGELDGDQVVAMYEEMHKKDPKLHEILWPVVLNTAYRIARMDDRSNAFLNRYMEKVGLLTPLLETDRDAFIRQLLKFADAEWSKLPEESRAHFRREFPEMNAVFEDTQLLKLAGVRSR